MTSQKSLDREQQYLIKEITSKAISLTPNLDFEKCYSITLLYYLAQYCDFDLRAIPPTYLRTVELLYKNPKSSYVHYMGNIMNSKNEYARAIKNAEIQVIGDDPRCPW